MRVNVEAGCEMTGIFMAGSWKKNTSTEAGFASFKAGCEIVLKSTAGCGDRFKIDGGDAG